MYETPAVSGQELYTSNLPETRVETPSPYDTLTTSQPEQQSEHTYDTLTTSQPQQQSEHTYEPVDNITSDPVKYETTQVNSTVGGESAYILSFVVSISFIRLVKYVLTASVLKLC